MIFRAVTGYFALQGIWGAVKYMPVSIASSIFSMGPILTTVFASIFLKERVTIYDYAALLSAFIGVIMVNNPFKTQDLLSVISPHSIFIGTVYALTGAFAFSGAIICIRIMNEGIHYTVGPFWYASGCTILGSLMHFCFLN
jgi:drug/metabolite transporter (DMT)-like permease